MIQKTTSVIILNWNTTKDTLECLKSLKKQTYKRFEVILVDNGSTKEEFGKLKRAVPNFKMKIKLYRLKKNVGFTGGNNFGIKKSIGSYIVFLNNDTEVERSWLENIIQPLENDESVGATSSKIMFYGTNRVQSAGGRLTFFGMAVNEGTGQLDCNAFDKPKETQWAAGMSFAVKKKILNKLKEFFCPFYFTYFEEVDMSWRIRSAGYKILYCPKSVVHHKGSISMKVNKTISAADMFTIRNKYLTFWRNLPLSNFILVFPFMIFYDLGRCVKHLLNGNPSFTVNFVSGLANFLSSLNKVAKPRKGKLNQLVW